MALHCCYHSKQDDMIGVNWKIRYWAEVFWSKYTVKEERMKKGIALLLLAALCLFNFINNNSSDQDPYLITDYSRLHPVKVERVVKGIPVTEDIFIAQLWFIMV